MDHEEVPLKQIRTFQGDVAEALQKEKRSLVSIQQAEHLKDSPASDASTVNSKRRIEASFFFLGSLILVTLGILGAWFGYNEFIKRSVTPVNTAPANRFIPINAEIDVDLATTSREAFIKSLTDALGGTTAKEIKQVVFVKTDLEEAGYLLPTSEFLERLKTQTPDSLVRAFDPLFMFGAYGESAFLVIKLTSFENTFAGMLAWEKTLGQDLGPLFATRALSRDLPLGTPFIDLIDKNKDIRMLIRSDQPILLYTFLDNNLLIITDKIDTLRILVERLAREKLYR